MFKHDHDPFHMPEGHVSFLPFLAFILVLVLLALAVHRIDDWIAWQESKRLTERAVHVIM